MKLDEIHTTGTTDNEDLGDHERTQAVVVSHISFAHEPGLEEAFKQLMGLPAFANALEKSFTEAFRRQVYDFVRQVASSQVMAGLMLTRRQFKYLDLLLSSSSGLGHWPFTSVTRVRVPSRVPIRLSAIA